MIIENMEENVQVKKIRELVSLIPINVQKREVVVNGEMGIYFLSLQSDKFDGEISIWSNSTCELALVSWSTLETIFHIDGKLLESEDCQEKISEILNCFLNDGNIRENKRDGK